MTNYEMCCRSMEDMARMINELTGSSEKELMEWLRKEHSKIRICYLSDIPVRIENSKRILAMQEAGNITDRTKNGFETKSRQYVFINCNNPEEYEGVHADWVILDFREPMRTIAESMLNDSCMPEGSRRIDDRRIGTSDSPMF